MVRNKAILLGFYQGLGDFVSAVPVMNQLLAQNNKLYVAASKQNVRLAEAIRFKGSAIELLDYSLFSIGHPGALVPFVRQLVRLHPDLVYVSPHAQRHLSSWKVPILLAIVKRLFWGHATIVGAADERLSRLLDIVLPVDRNLDLLHREWSFHNLAGSFDLEEPPEYCRGIKWNINRPDQEEGADLVIHPGASKAVRMWPVAHYREMVNLLGESVQIAVVGLESELEPLRAELGRYSNVRFFVGSLVDVVAIMYAARAVITMDSGFSHIAASLGVNHLAIFGASSPDKHGPFAENSKLLFNPSLECQPCDQYECRFEHALCMQTITPQTVVGHLERMLTPAIHQQPDHLSRSCMVGAGPAPPGNCI
ncbi:MAG: glycosyltransferase family 9 protein [bacterium]